MASIGSVTGQGAVCSGGSLCLVYIAVFAPLLCTFAVATCNHHREPSMLPVT